MKKKKGFVMSSAVYMVITLSGLLIAGTFMVINAGTLNQTKTYDELYNELNNDINFEYSE